MKEDLHLNLRGAALIPTVNNLKRQELSANSIIPVNVLKEKSARTSMYQKLVNSIVSGAHAQWRIHVFTGTPTLPVMSGRDTERVLKEKTAATSTLWR